MPTLAIQFVYFGSSGSHTRQPRSVSTYGGFTPIPGFAGVGGETVSSGLPWTTLTSPPLPGYVFAFTNLSGCTGGPQTTFHAGTQLSGVVGTEAVLELHVYVLAGSPNGNGGSGAVIDAFDATIGSLVDNDFVKVNPDPTGALSTQANMDGWVPTTSSGYTITADHPNIGPYQNLPTTANFHQWVDLANPNPPASVVSGANLTPAKGETVYALAFYQDPVGTPKAPNPCQSLIDEMENMGPGDFPNWPAYVAARNALARQLIECERAHSLIPATTGG